MFSLVLFGCISENCAVTKLKVRKLFLCVRTNKRVLCISWNETFSLHSYWMQHRAPLNVMLNRSDHQLVFFHNWLKFCNSSYCTCINMQRKTVSSLKGKKIQRKEATVDSFPKCAAEGFGAQCLRNEGCWFRMFRMGWSIFSTCICTMLNDSLRAGRHCCRTLLQNLRNIWTVELFFISLINVSLKYCLGLSRR